MKRHPFYIRFDTDIANGTDLLQAKSQPASQWIKIYIKCFSFSETKPLTGPYVFTTHISLCARNCISTSPRCMFWMLIVPESYLLGDIMQSFLPPIYIRYDVIELSWPDHPQIKFRQGVPKEIKSPEQSRKCPRLQSKKWTIHIFEKSLI